MGSVFKKSDSAYLQIKYKNHLGNWVRVPTKFKEDQREEAELLLKQVERKIQEGISETEIGPNTFKRYALKWLGFRKRQGIGSVKDDEARLNNYVFQFLGNIPIVELKPKDFQILFRELKKQCGQEKDDFAPRTVLHIHNTVNQCLKDAVADGVIRVNPCVLKKGDLPKKQDKDPQWRKTAIFSREEISKVLVATEIPEDRRMFWFIAFFAGQRFGEVSALRWKDYDPNRRPLGHLSVAFSYSTKKKSVKSTKTEVVRDVPVHPTLARALAEWRQFHWSRFWLKEPTGDDLIVPSREGNHRSANHMLKKFHEDLARLGMRPRRQHDLRRTFISLSVEDGAKEEILKVITHDPGQEAFDLYKSFSWEAKCEAMSALKLDLGPEGEPLVRSWSGPEKVNQFKGKNGGADGTRMRTYYVGRGKPRVISAVNIDDFRKWMSTKGYGGTNERTKRTKEIIEQLAAATTLDPNPKRLRTLLLEILTNLDRE